MGSPTEPEVPPPIVPPPTPEPPEPYVPDPAPPDPAPLEPPVPPVTPDPLTPNPLAHKTGDRLSHRCLLGRRVAALGGVSRCCRTRRATQATSRYGAWRRLLDDRMCLSREHPGTVSHAISGVRRRALIGLSSSWSGPRCRGPVLPRRAGGRYGLWRRNANGVLRDDLRRCRLST